MVIKYTKKDITKMFVFVIVRMVKRKNFMSELKTLTQLFKMPRNLMEKFLKYFHSMNQLIQIYMEKYLVSEILFFL